MAKSSSNASADAAIVMSLTSLSSCHRDEHLQLVVLDGWVVRDWWIGRWREGHAGVGKERDVEHERLDRHGQLLAQHDVDARLQVADEVVLERLRLDVDDVDVVDLAHERVAAGNDLVPDLPDRVDVEAEALGVARKHDRRLGTTPVVFSGLTPAADWDPVDELGG